MKYKILLASIFAILLASCNEEGEEIGLLVKNTRNHYFYTGSDSMNYSEELCRISFYNSLYDTLYYRYYSVDVATGDDFALTEGQFDMKYQSYILDSMKHWSDASTQTSKILDNGTYESVAPSEELYNSYNVPLSVR